LRPFGETFDVLIFSLEIQLRVRLMSSETKPHSLSVLLVEDEILIQMMVADMIAELGHTVVAEASTLQHALALAQSASFDIAILDINLSGQRIDPVAEALSSRNIPFIFASGYGEAGLADRFRGRPMLQKPFILSVLGEAIETALQPLDTPLLIRTGSMRGILEEGQFD
jgi:CheY-like chemotaxis protein